MSIPNFILVILILTLSALIRPVAFLMSAIIFAPAFLFLILCDAEKRRIACHLLAAAVLVGAIGVVSEWAAYALSDGWAQALEYNYLRAQFTDFARVPWVAGASIYRDMGWTRNDYDIFNSWYTHDSIFNFKQVSFIVERAAVPATKFEWVWVSNWLKYPLQSTALLLSLGAQLAILLSRRQGRFLCLLVIFGEFFAVFLAAITGRPPVFRVWAAIADAALMVLGTFSLLSSAPERTSGSRSPCFCISAILGLLSIWILVDSHQLYRHEAHRYRDWLDQHRGFFTGKVVVWGGSLRFEFLVTPVQLYFPLPQTTMAPIGALSHTPMTSATLADLRIKDLTNTLCRSTDVRLIADPSFIKILAKFCIQHERVTPTYRIVSAFDSSFLYTLEKAVAKSGDEKR